MSTKRAVALTLCVFALVAAIAPIALAADGSYTGEVVDMACYLAKGAHGEGHAACAKTCVKNGQPMGLLTDSGELMLLAADHDNSAPFESLKDMAGHKAQVTGTLSDRDGIKMVTVTGAKSAS